MKNETEYFLLNELMPSILNLNKKYPNINYGGCGTFSYFLHKTLKDKKNIISEFVYTPSLTAPGKRPDYDIKFTHIYVKVGDYYIDNNGIYKYSFRQ